MADNTVLTDREKALEWWNGLHYTKREHYIRMENLEHSEFSESHIENIWRKETQQLSEQSNLNTMQQLTETTQSTPKYKIGVEIHKSGSENDNYLRIVTMVNEGKSKVSPSQLMGYIDVRNAMWPTLNQTTYLHQWPTFHIFEGEKKEPTLTLTWKEIHELSELEQEMVAETAEEMKERYDSNVPDADDISHLPI